MARLWLFSSTVELAAAYPQGPPDDLAFDLSGIGVVDAVRGTMMAIERYQPDEVVFVGTAGAYPGCKLQPGAIVLVNEARIDSGDLVDGRMRVAAHANRRVRTDRMLNDRLLERIPEAHLVRAVCTLGVTEDEELAASLAESGDVENLEAFSVITASEGVPVAVLLAITNRVGPGGGEAWQQNYPNAMSSLAELISVMES